MKVHVYLRFLRQSQVHELRFFLRRSQESHFESNHHLLQRIIHISFSNHVQLFQYNYPLSDCIYKKLYMSF